MMRFFPIAPSFHDEGAFQLNNMRESMVRVSIHFPVNDEEEIQAFSLFMSYLLSFKLGKKTQPTDVTGFTYDTETHTGYYWSIEIEDWIPDQVRHLFIDFNLEEDDPILATMIDRLKQKFFEFYLEVDRVQEAVWCVTSTIKVW
jgi:hypothetical protein